MYNLDNLNPHQRDAVVYEDGSLLILGGPGSGKTQVLTCRLAHLIHEQKVNPGNILVIAFTTKTSLEMKALVEEMIGYSIERDNVYSHLYFGTFRSICLSILRQHIDRLGYALSFSICDENTRLSRIKACLSDLHIDPIRFQPRAVATKISERKTNPAQAKKSAVVGSKAGWDEVVSRVYRQYEELLYEAHELDHDDICMLTVRLFQQNPVVLAYYRDLFQHILIDEYQETTLVQHRLVRMLSTQENCFYITGDDDQSIFKTRGADVMNMINLEKDYPWAKVITLEQNYRSTGSILDAACGVISRNSVRKIKTQWTQNNIGDKIIFHQAKSANDEADFICRNIVQVMNAGRNPWDIAILYRTNAQSSVLEAAIRNHCIPYRIFDDSAFDGQQEVVDIPTYIPMVTLLTLHNAKGLEFPIVFIAGLEEGLLPHSRAEESNENLEEERRLFYLGITRAKEQLIITCAKERNLYGYSQARDRSRFIEEIPAKLIRRTQNEGQS